MRRAAWTMVVAGALLVPAAALADEYHVYKNGNGECEIDSRSHDRWKNDRGTDVCFGHSSSHSSALELRIKMVKDGACKCPSGETCR